MTDADVDGAHIRTPAAHLLLPPDAELVERGHIIAQPPLYKVKAGKQELYLKDGPALDSFLLRIALNHASVTTGGAKSARPLTGETLAELARKPTRSPKRHRPPGNFMDAGPARHCRRRGASSSTPCDARSRRGLQTKLRGLNTTSAPPKWPVSTPAPTSPCCASAAATTATSRQRHHQDFVHGADYAALAETAETFRGLLG